MSSQVQVAGHEAGMHYLDQVASAAITTLAYFSVFRHPLRKDELARYMQFFSPTGEDLSWTLARLTAMGLVGMAGDCYYLNGHKDLVPIRKERQHRALAWLAKVATPAAILSQVPFLAALSLSGSLSKGTQDADGDIDFFVLVKPGRVWTSRFLLGLFLRLLPAAGRERFCANFFLACDHLVLRRKNLFIATEIAFLRPLINDPLWQDFYAANDWVRDFYPDWSAPVGMAEAKPERWMKRLAEWALGGAFGNWVEARLFQTLSGRYKRQNAARHGDDPLAQRALHYFEIGHSRAFEFHLRARVQATLKQFQERNQVQLMAWPWDLDESQEIRTKAS